MREIQTLKTYLPKRRKKQPDQDVQNLRQTNGSPLQERKMNAPIIAVLSILGLGILGTLALIISKVPATKPILIEKRPIVYRRRP